MSFVFASAPDTCRGTFVQRSPFLFNSSDHVTHWGNAISSGEISSNLGIKIVGFSGAGCAASAIRKPFRAARGVLPPRTRRQDARTPCEQGTPPAGPRKV